MTRLVVVVDYTETLTRQELLFNGVHATISAHEENLLSDTMRCEVNRTEYDDNVRVIRKQ